MIGIDKMPIQIVFLLAEAAGDVRLQRSDVLSLAALARYSAPDGIVGVDENGKPMSDPGHVAPKIGSAASTVYKSLGALERAGYIERQRGWTRIILSDSAPQS